MQDSLFGLPLICLEAMAVCSVYTMNHGLMQEECGILLGK